MFMRSINKRVIVGIILLIVDAIVLMSFMKRAESISLLPLIIILIPGAIGGFIIYYEWFRGRW
jgi:hypothetical protein